MAHQKGWNQKKKFHWPILSSSVSRCLQTLQTGQHSLIKGRIQKDDCALVWDCPFLLFVVYKREESSDMWADLWFWAQLWRLNGTLTFEWSFDVWLELWRVSGSLIFSGALMCEQISDFKWSSDFEQSSDVWMELWFWAELWFWVELWRVNRAHWFSWQQ